MVDCIAKLAPRGSSVPAGRLVIELKLKLINRGCWVSDSQDSFNTDDGFSFFSFRCRHFSVRVKAIGGILVCMNSQGMLEHSANDDLVPVAKRMNSHTLRSVWPMNELMVQTHNDNFAPSCARGHDRDKGPAGVTTHIAWYFLVFGLND
jgi:hypothetical protein